MNDDATELYPTWTVDQLMAFPFDPPEYFLHPIIPIASVVMVAAERGIGKTHFAVGCAVAIASGTSFLKYHAAKPRRVLYIDGEMCAPLMKERLEAAMERVPKNVAPFGDNLRLLTPDMCLDGITPDLGTEDGQAAIDELIDCYNIELIVIDNISTLMRAGGAENDSESWVGPQSWLCRLKASRKTVLLVHHLGKNGSQRGTSKREDILSNSIKLVRPKDYRRDEGARFEVHLSKARGIVGEDADSFEASLAGGVWVTRPIGGCSPSDIHLLKAGGMSVREIADEVGMSKSTVARMLANKGDGDASAG